MNKKQNNHHKSLNGVFEFGEVDVAIEVNHPPSISSIIKHFDLTEKLSSIDLSSCDKSFGKGLAVSDNYVLFSDTGEWRLSTVNCNDNDVEIINDDLSVYNISPSYLLNILIHYNVITSEDYDNIIDDKKLGKSYLEIETFGQGDIKIYVEHMEDCFEFYVPKNKSDLVMWQSYNSPKRLEIGDFRFTAEYEKQNLNDVIENYITSDIMKAATHDQKITKLDNGFVFNNLYYKTLEDLEDDYIKSLKESSAETK